MSATLASFRSSLTKRRRSPSWRSRSAPASTSSRTSNAAFILKKLVMNKDQNNAICVEFFAANGKAFSESAFPQSLTYQSGGGNDKHKKETLPASLIVSGAYVRDSGGAEHQRLAQRRDHRRKGERDREGRRDIDLHQHWHRAQSYDRFRRLLQFSQPAGGRL